MNDTPTTLDALETSRIKILTEREIGRRLAEMQEAGELAVAGDPSRRNDVLCLDDLGLTRMQSSRFQREASLGEAREPKPARSAP